MGWSRYTAVKQSCGSGNKIYDEMGGACGKHWGEEKYIQGSSESERKHVGVDGKKILR
jgi:hypothetical protein